MDVTERAERALELARLAADAAAAAEGERVQRERVEFFAAIHEALSTVPDRRELMAKVTRAAVPRLGDWCAIHLLVPGEVVPEVEIAHVDPTMAAYARELQERFPYDPQARVGVPHVIRTVQTEFYPEIDREVMANLDATEEEVAIIEQLALRSSITVPLVKRGRVFGAMQFVMSSSSRRYTSDDVMLANAVAGRIAATLENRRLHEVQRDIAETLQRSLLPASLPDIPGLEVAVRYWAAGEGSTVGGDFYDLFAITDDTWAVVIGDVCGTGPRAASLTGLDAAHDPRQRVARRRSDRGAEVAEPRHPPCADGFVLHCGVRHAHRGRRARSTSASRAGATPSRCTCTAVGRRRSVGRDRCSESSPTPQGR